MFGETVMMILCPRVEYDDEGRAHLSGVGKQRAETALKYMSQNPKVFPFGTKILCAGGYSGAAHGEKMPPIAYREGRIMANYLHENDVPTNGIEEELDSISTVTNFTYSIKKENGFIVPQAYNPNHPLRVVSSPSHLKRAALIASKLAFSAGAILPVPTEQPDGVAAIARNALYRVVLFGAQGSAELEAREDFLLRGVSALRSLKALGQAA